MIMLPGNGTLPDPPEGLCCGGVRLLFEEWVPADEKLGLSPYYHFRILIPDGSDVGHINFRVGDTEHVRLYAGHIGYAIEEKFRGHHYALQACRAISPFVRLIYVEVVITCDPDNEASKRTIEALGAEFVGEIPVPPHDLHYRQGSRSKRRYLWTP